MIKVTGRVKMSGMLRITQYAGWENITISWGNANVPWQYWD